MDASQPPRWRSLKVVILLVLFLGGGAIAVNWSAAESWRAHPDLTLMFPYLAATTLFFSACAWVIAEAHVTVEAALFQSPSKKAIWSDPAVGALVASFVLIAAALAFGGMAGPAALKAIKSINCYLMGSGDGCITAPLGERKTMWGMPFNYAAAVGNAAALATLVYLGFKCRQLTNGAWQGAADPTLVANCIRAITTLLVLASALLVSSTLTLFLLFSAAGEIDVAVTKPNVPSSQDASSALSLSCSTKAGSDSAIDCQLSGASKAVPSGTASIAPSMAFVAGLSFTGALFFLFMATSSALDDALARAASIAQGTNAAFKRKEWRENVGIPEAGASDRVLQALALLAPAITAGIALLLSK